MKHTNLLGKIGIVITYALLFVTATYFGKAVNYTDAFLFTIGLILGMALLEADENFLFKYYDPLEKRLATRSFLFILSLVPLGLFILTSTGSAIGVGLFLSIISGLSLEFFALRSNKAEFKNRFLSQLNREISSEEQKVATALFIAGTLFYAFFVIFLGR